MPIRQVTCAHIWTGDPLRPWTSGMSLADGRIESLGESHGHGERDTLNLSGAWILPGLIDAHAHLLMGGLSMQRLDLSSATCREDFDRLIESHAAQLAPNAWLEAFGWNEQHWHQPPVNGNRPDLSWLRAAGNRKVVAWRCDQHAALVNQAVLDLLDIRNDIAGGTIVRDAHGAPTGLLLEQSAWKILVPRIPAPSLPMRRQACADACAHLLSLGVTTVGAMEYLDDIEQVLVPARDTESLTLRLALTALDRERPLPFARARAIRTDHMLRVIGFKSFADGTLGSSTASMLEDYLDATSATDRAGSLMEHALDGTLADWMREVLAAGYSPSVHAIGDRALAEVLRAALSCDPQKRTRFEHAQTVHPNSIDDFRGRIVSMQPFHKATDSTLARTRLGAHRDNRLFQFRSFLRSGAHLAFGSDWPIASANPLEGMHVAITGQALDGTVYGENQNLTAHQAIAAYTSGAADALGLSPSLGQLTPGAHADFIALDRNPLECNWMNEIPRVLLTAVGGIIRYDGGSSSTVAPTAQIVRV